MRFHPAISKMLPSGVESPTGSKKKTFTTKKHFLENWKQLCASIKSKQTQTDTTRTQSKQQQQQQQLTHTTSSRASQVQTRRLK
jgi:DNA-binding transcriptional regulator GbsR (MarR family)